jgi:hypothetical protein
MKITSSTQRHYRWTPKPHLWPETKEMEHGHVRCSAAHGGQNDHAFNSHGQHADMAQACPCVFKYSPKSSVPGYWSVNIQ